MLETCEKLAKEKLAEDDCRRSGKVKTVIQNELMQQIDRYPFVEQAVAKFLQNTDLSIKLAASASDIYEDNGKAAEKRKFAAEQVSARQYKHKEKQHAATTIVENVLGRNAARTSSPQSGSYVPVASVVGPGLAAASPKKDLNHLSTYPRDLSFTRVSSV